LSGYGRLTLAVFEPPLDHRIVNVCVDLEFVEVTLHAVDAMLVPLFILRVDLLGLQSGNLLALSLDVLDLLFAVLNQDFAGLLETLVGQLLKGNTRTRENGGTASTRADRSKTTGTEELALGSGSENIVLVEGRKRRKFCRCCCCGGCRGGDFFANWSGC
jgi:hypothetical protein